MRPRRSLLVILIWFSFVLPATASQIVSQPLSELVDESRFIMLGSVTRVDRITTDKITGAVYRVEVEIKSSIKGNPGVGNFTLPVRVGGLRGFDVSLSPGQQAVFFLRSLDSGQGTLTHWGSLAIFKEGYFH